MIKYILAEYIHPFALVSTGVWHKLVSILEKELTAVEKQELDKEGKKPARYRIIAPCEENLAESEKRNIRWLIREQEACRADFTEVCCRLKKEGLTRCYP